MKKIFCTLLTIIMIISAFPVSFGSHARTRGTAMAPAPVTERDEEVIPHASRQQPRATRHRTPAPKRYKHTSQLTPSGVWGRLAHCESGSDGLFRANTGNGFYGAYQFTLSSWHAIGGTGYPQNASASEQTMRAKKLKKLQGWAAWPACSRKLGLR